MTPNGGSHGKPHPTTKILSHARRRGCVAARGARAAAEEAADDRLLGREFTTSPGSMDRCFRAAAARAWVDRRPQYRDRVSVGGGALRPLTRTRRRAHPA